MRRAAKWLLALGGGLVTAALVALGSALWWLTQTPEGLRWALARAQAADGRVAIDGAQGTLAHGIEIARISWADGGTRIEALAVRGRIDLLSLLAATLRIEGLRASAVDVRMGQQAASGAPPERLALPLALSIPEAAVDRLEVHRDGESYVVSRLRFTYEAGAFGHALRDASAQTPWGLLSLDASMAAAAPFALELDAALERSEGKVTAKARLLPFAGPRIESLQAAISRLDLASIDAALPRTALEIRLDGASRAGSLLAGKLSAGNSLAGPLDERKLPLRSVQADYSLRGASVHLANLRAAAAGGTIAGSATLEAKRARLDLQLAKVDLRAVLSTLRQTQLAGALGLDLAPDRQSARARLAQDDMRLEVDAQRKGERVEVSSLTFSNLDPSRFGDYPQAALDGSARLRFSGRRAHDVEALVRWGENELSARGSFGAAGDRLALSLSAPALPLDGFAGDVQAEATVTGTLSEPRLSVSARASEALIGERVRADAMSARFSGTLREHSVELAASGEGFALAAKLAGGWLGERGWEGRLTELRNAGRWPLDLAEPVPVRISPQRVHLERLRARLGEGQLEVGALEWTPGRLSTRGEFAGLPASWLIVPAGLGEALRSTLTLDGAWSIESTPLLDGRISVRRAGGDLTVLKPEALALGLTQAGAVVEFDRGKVAASLDLVSKLGVVHAKGSAAGTAADSALSVSAQANVDDIRALAGPLPAYVRIAGRGALTLEASGTLGEPQLAGGASADGLSVQLPPYGVFLEDGKLRARLEGDALRVEELSLRGGEGRFTASGAVPLKSAAGPAALKWTAERLQLLGRPDMRLVVSGEGVAGRDGGSVQLQGKLRVDSGLLERGFSRLPQLGSDVVIVGEKESSQAGKRTNIPLDLDVLVDLGERFRVREAGFDGLLRGEVHLSAVSGGELRAFGRIYAADATYRAYGQSLAVDPGSVIFNGPIGNPALQVTAMRRNQPVAAGVRITGTLEQPHVELVSEPEVPEGAKLSWLVLGRAPSDAKGADLALLQTAATALLARGDSVPITTRVADAVGLDEIALHGSGELANTTVALGKRLSKRLYLTYEQGVGAAAQSLAKLDFSLTDRISLRAQTGNASSGAGVYYRYSWD